MLYELIACFRSFTLTLVLYYTIHIIIHRYVYSEPLIDYFTFLAFQWAFCRPKRHRIRWEQTKYPMISRRIPKNICFICIFECSMNFSSSLLLLLLLFPNIFPRSHLPISLSTTLTFTISRNEEPTIDEYRCQWLRLYFPKYLRTFQCDTCIRTPNCLTIVAADWFRLYGQSTLKK